MTSSINSIRNPCHYWRGQRCARAALVLAVLREVAGWALRGGDWAPLSCVPAAPPYNKKIVRRLTDIVVCWKTQRQSKTRGSSAEQTSAAAIRLPPSATRDNTETARVNRADRRDSGYGKLICASSRLKNRAADPLDF